MFGLYPKLMLGWERRLNSVDQNRHVRPFDWGGEWLRKTPINGLSPWPAQGSPQDIKDILADISAWNDRVVAASTEFFHYDPVRDYQLEPHVDGHAVLRFESPVATPYPENRQVYARWFPAAGAKRARVSPFAS